MNDQQQSSAVTVAQPATIEFALDSFPEERFNRLIPTETVRIPTDLLVPVFTVVRLSEADVYHSNDMPAGHKAPKAHALSKLATAAGIQFLEETRLDDGSNPDVCGVQVVAEMLLPTGQRVRAPGTRWVDMSKMSWASPAQRGKFAGFLYEHTATRARNRAIRALLSIRGSYPDAELRKPFAVVTFAPNMNHPEIRSRIVDAMAPAIAAGFGPAPKVLGPGDQSVPEAPEEDVLEGEARVARSADPDWFGPSPAQEQDAEAAIVRVLRDKATKSGLNGPITAPQKEALAGAMGELGLELIAAGVKAVWDVDLTSADGKPKLALTAAQAQALIDTARSDDFVLLWRDAFGKAVEQ